METKAAAACPALPWCLLHARRRSPASPPACRAAPVCPPRCRQGQCTGRLAALPSVRCARRSGTVQVMPAFGSFFLFSELRMAECAREVHARNRQAARDAAAAAAAAPGT